MSLSRTIKRHMARQDVYLSTHLENKTLPVTSRPTMALAGNTFSGMRRRMLQGKATPGKPLRGKRGMSHPGSTYTLAQRNALLFNTLPRAVRKGELSLADYNAGVRV